MVIRDQLRDLEGGAYEPTAGTARSAMVLIRGLIWIERQRDCLRGHTLSDRRERCPTG